MSHPRNIIGPRISQLRKQQGLTQPEFAAKCNLWGWNLSRETLAKIETQVRWVSDAEMFCLSKVLGVSLENLLPDNPSTVKLIKNQLD